MNLRESLMIALTSLDANRLRAALTMLGIIIGITAVVAMVSLGQGIGRIINTQFEDLGATRLTVSTSSPFEDFSVTVSTRRIDPLTSRDAEALANPAIAPHISRVAPDYGVAATIASGGRSLGLSVTGVTADYSAVYNWRVSSGRFIAAEDDQTRARVVVLGTTVVRRLFGSENTNVIGLPVTINDQVFTVVGVMTRRTSSLGFEPNTVAFVPIQTAQTRLSSALARGGGYVVSQITVNAISREDMTQATREIQTYLRQARGLTVSGQRDDFTVDNPAQLLNSVRQISNLLTLFLGLVGGISLLVGGIGVMNIMLVTVTERTKEIGLRKAVGARYGDILAQFLIESVLLSLAGGVVGVALAQGIVSLGNLFFPAGQFTLSVEAVIVASLVSTGVGVGFGLYPANRAARMDPIQALRFE